MICNVADNAVRTTSRAPRLIPFLGSPIPRLPRCASVGWGYPRHRHSVAPRLRAGAGVRFGVGALYVVGGGKQVSGDDRHGAGVDGTEGVTDRKMAAAEPRSGEVVDNPRRPQGAAGTRRTPPNLGAAERAMSSDGHTQGLRQWWGHRLKRGNDNIAAPQLIPFFWVAPIPRLPRCAAVGWGYQRHRHSVARGQ